MQKHDDTVRQHQLQKKTIEEHSKQYERRDQTMWNKKWTNTGKEKKKYLKWHGKIQEDSIAKVQSPSAAVCGYHKYKDWCFLCCKKAEL